MTGRIETGDGWELRLGDYREVLADVECDAVITDPPYSERTHDGMYVGTIKVKGGGSGRGALSAAATRVLTRTGVVYASWSAADMGEFCEWSALACRSWSVVVEDDRLVREYADAMERIGWYAFQPLPFVEPGKQPRLSGDGPASWSCWIGVARPRLRRFAQWGSLPGAYIAPPSVIGTRGDRVIKGGKPTWLMRALVRDYSRPGDLVCDPCAGGGTTLLAAVIEGRRAIGAEIDPATFDLAVARLRKGHTRDLFTGVA